MSIKSKILQSIEKEFGSRATSSILERELYSRDLAPVPELLVKPLFNTVPDLVVRPADTDEVAKLIRMASSGNIPVTPRAGGSTVFFDSVPIKGGILMDLNMLNGVVAFNENDFTVRVKTATTWKELERYLNKRNFACKSMPSSAPSATIGGWLSMMGYGIGSLRYGSLESQVRSLEVVTPDGNILKVTDKTNPSIKEYSSKEGTLGIITEVELETRTLKEMKHFLIHTEYNNDAVTIINSIIKSEIKPYNIHFSDQNYLKKINELGLSHLNQNSGCLLAIDFEICDEELLKIQQNVERVVGASESASLLSEHDANYEWEERFNAMGIKRGGPSILGAELWLPVDNLSVYLEEIEKMSESYNVNLFTYAHIVTPDKATVMTMFYADEMRTIPYIINLSLVKKIQDIGHRFKGSPYGTGLWNTPYIKRIYSKSYLRKMKRLKKKIDPMAIMNPGKVYSPPFLLNAFNFYLGMEVFALVRRIFGRRW